MGGDCMPSLLICIIGFIIYFGGWLLILLKGVPLFVEFFFELIGEFDNNENEKEK